MTAKQVLQWAITFPVLTLFTIYTLDDGSIRGIERALAKDSISSPYVVLVRTDTSNHLSVLQRLLSRMSDVSTQATEVCHLSEDQFHILEVQRGVSTYSLKVNGREIMVADSSSPLSLFALAQLLRIDPARFECSEVPAEERRLFPSPAHLS